MHCLLIKETYQQTDSDKLNSEHKAEECDATEADSSTTAR
jgi:hypothetical protein